MLKNGLVRIALLAAMVLTFQGTWALAGTTGTLSGVVTLTDGTPVAGAKVAASSPSESVSTTTDTSGHFVFVSLIPDTYSVTASKDNYDTAQQQGVSVFADNTANVHLTTQASAKVLGKVVTTGSAALIKPGTTSDVYSINSTMQAKTATLGGGGGLNNAYSAIASVPGVVVPPGQQGWFQTVHIRGGDFDQVGYEFDGVPVIRSYDNYPTVNASALGQQELQVYTGAAPANSEAQGLAGFINQVIKTGTYPGSVTAAFGVGTPALYNKVNIEAGGATPDRNFSYYVGVGMYDQSPRFINNHNGSDVNALWGTPLYQAPCPGGPAVVGFPQGTAGVDPNLANCSASGVGPGGYVLGPFQLGGQSHLADRENVLNLHFGLPHRNDSGKDDIQLLMDTSEIFNTFYTAATDQGLGHVYTLNVLNCIGAGNTPAQCVSQPNTIGYTTSEVYTGRLGTMLDPLTFGQNVVNYNFPSQKAGLPGAQIPINQRDGTSNGQGIFKLQYQHNIGSNAYLRLYGYTFYSDWLQNGPGGIFYNVIGPASPDYELSNHTRGVSATFADQIDNKNLLTLEASTTQALNVRVNNTTYTAGPGTNLAWLVDSTHPLSGICYQLNGVVIANATCGLPNGPETPEANDGAQATTVQLGPVGVGGPVPNITGLTCGSGPCGFYVAENGFNGGGNVQHPRFSAASITDQIKPSDKLLINIGIREDRFDFKGGDTNHAPLPGNFGTARQFWFNAYNQSYCTPPGVAQAPVRKNFDPTISCATGFGAGYTAAHITNVPNGTNSFSVTEPRLGATYTLNTDNVLRFSYGKYTEPPSSAFEQYNVLQQNLAGYDNRFQSTGFNSTNRPVAPATSNNYDLSLEHHFANSDMSFKLTPYLRQTQNQVQNFFLDQKTGFVSGLNAGQQTSSGVEFELNNGDFNRNGLAEVLTYTYTKSTIKYKAFSNGTTVLDAINQGVQAYNAYTSACSGNTSKACGGGLDSLGAPAAACYAPGGVADPTCAAGDFANPYWNKTPQALFDTGASYAPFSTIPGGLESASSSFIYPNAGALIINYKHDKWSFTPTFQFVGGTFYGSPFNNAGVDPAGCGFALPTLAQGDPRYSGTNAGFGYDALTCGTLGAGIPNTSSGKFDNLGAFRNPSQFLANLAVSYDATSRVSVSASLVNLIDRCFGGSKEPWTQYSDNRVCAYGLPLGGAGLWFPVGNVYNPGTTFQPQARYPYQQLFGTSPVQATLEMTVKM